MPRKDPMTGCEVMTTGEFVAKMAKAEGITPAQYMEEEARLLQEEYDKSNAHLKENALEIAKQFVKEWNEFDEELAEPMPVKLLELLESHIDESFWESKMHLKMRAENDKGKVGILTIDEGHTYGSYFEPPDWDLNVTWAY